MAEQTIINTLLGRKTKSKKGKKQSRKGKKKAATRSMKSMTAKTIPNDNVDVRSSADIKQLKELLKKNKIVIVLVYADWCGHCQTFKKDIWSNLSQLPSRKVPMAQIKAEELEKTPLANANVDAFPTVMMVGQDLKPTNLDDTRNLEKMKRIVNADPAAILSGVPTQNQDPEAMLSGESTQTQDPASVFEESLQATMPSANVGEYSTVGTMNRASTSVVPASPPDVEQDFVGTATDDWATIGNSANATRGMNTSFTGERIYNSAGSAGTASGPLVGGTLFASLYNMARKGTGMVMGGGSPKRKTRRHGGRKPRRRTTAKRS